MRKIIINIILLIIALIGAISAATIAGITAISMIIIPDNEKWKIGGKNETWNITNKLFDFMDSIFK